jgi:hypothetical protein
MLAQNLVLPYIEAVTWSILIPEFDNLAVFWLHASVASPGIIIDPMIQSPCDFASVTTAKLEPRRIAS